MSEKKHRIANSKFFNNRYVEVVTAVLIAAVVFMLLGGIIGGIIYILGLYATNDAIATASVYASFIGIWVVGCLYMRFTRKNRPILKTLGRGLKGNNVKTALIWGLTTGLGVNMLCAFVAWLHGDIQLSFTRFNIFYVILLLVCVGIQAGAEELTGRVFLYQRLRRSFPRAAWAAIVGSAVFFSAGHFKNDGITWLALINIALIGILYAEMVYFLDSVWAPILSHTTWNFSQSIILGLPNSGMIVDYHIFSLNEETARDSFAYNTGFGVEATALACIIIAALCVVLLIYGLKKKSQPTDIWEGTEVPTSN